MQKYIRLNTAIILPDGISKRVVDISKKLGEIVETEFALDGKNFIPHITLYTVEFPLKNLDKIYSVLLDFCKSREVFDIDLTGVELDDSEGVLGAAIGVKNSDYLYDLHRSVIKILNPLREGHIRDKYKDPSYIKKFSADKRNMITDNILQTGYARVYKAYDPHISLTAFKINTYKKSDNINIFKPTKMTVKNIGVFAAGEWGTCTKLLKKFDLKT